MTESGDRPATATATECTLLFTPLPLPNGGPQPQTLDPVLLHRGQYLVVGRAGPPLPEEYGFGDVEAGGLVHRRELSVGRLRLQKWGVNAAEDISQVLLAVANGPHLTAGYGEHRTVLPVNHPWRIVVDGKEVDDVVPRRLDRAERHRIDLVYRPRPGAPEHVFLRATLLPRPVAAPGPAPRPRTHAPLTTEDAIRELRRFYWGDGGSGGPLWLKDEHSWLRVMARTAERVAAGVPAPELAGAVLRSVPDLTERVLKARWRSALERSRFVEYEYERDLPLAEDHPLVQVLGRELADEVWRSNGRIHPDARLMHLFCAGLSVGSRPFFPSPGDVADEASFRRWQRGPKRGSR